MDDALAHERLNGVLKLIDQWGDLYERRWGYVDNREHPELASQVEEGIDKVRTRTQLARGVIAAMGETSVQVQVWLWTKTESLQELRATITEEIQTALTGVKRSTAPPA